MLEFTIENKNPIELTIIDKKINMFIEMQNNIQLDMELLSKGTDYGPTIEEYLQIIDWIDNYNMNTYSIEDINKIQNYINFYAKGDETNE